MSAINLASPSDLYLVKKPVGCIVGLVRLGETLGYGRLVFTCGDGVENESIQYAISPVDRDG